MQPCVSNSPQLIKLPGWLKPAALRSECSDCTLVVPTFRRPDVMVRLLETLRDLCDAPGEVVVVDGSPDSATEQAVRRWSDSRALPFDLLWVGSPAGLTLQRNVGIDVSHQQFVFFLDDDCLPRAGYFRNLRTVFAEDQAGQIGGVRGFFTNSIGAPPALIWKVRCALGLVPRGEPGAYYPTGTSSSWNSVEPFQGTRPVEVLAGGAAAYRREVFQKHRFSKFFYGYSQGEDVEMSRRIARDWKLAVRGDALVEHNHAPGGRPEGFSRGRMVIRNRYFIWKRHSPKVQLKHRVQFWLDHALIAGFSLARGLRPPWTMAPWLYAFGIAWGGVECCVRPPRYKEPPVQREFELASESDSMRHPAASASAV